MTKLLARDGLLDAPTIAIERVESRIDWRFRALGSAYGTPPACQAAGRETRLSVLARSHFEPLLGHTVAMRLRNVAATIVALVLSLVAVGCTSTTVIGEGRLGTPVESATGTDRGDRALPDSDEPATEDSTSSDSASSDGASSESTSRDDGASDDTTSDRDPADDDVISLGSDELIAAWSEACLDGSDLACDVLFTITERGSEAELLAQTCGGRSDVEVRFCTPDIEPFEDRLWFDADSPGLPDVTDDCLDGDLISCDFLYFRSEVGSSYEELGNSCGNRVAIAVPDCRSALAE